MKFKSRSEMAIPALVFRKRPPDLDFYMPFFIKRLMVVWRIGNPMIKCIKSLQNVLTFITVFFFCAVVQSIVNVI